MMTMKDAAESFALFALHAPKAMLDAQHDRIAVYPLGDLPADVRARLEELCWDDDEDCDGSLMHWV